MTDIPAPIPQIHNIVSTAQIHCEERLDLERLHKLIPFSSFNRKKFAAVTIRYCNPDSTILLFTSGKLVVTGSKTKTEAILTTYYICKLLRSLCTGQSFHVVAFQIQNIVAHVDIKIAHPKILNIRALYERHHMYCTYQRHLFPGLILRWPQISIVVLCFFSGKIILTGAKQDRDIFTGWDYIWTILRDYIN
jgi:transcription initiation factor TFIID TATA-box-binding protein